MIPEIEITCGERKFFINCITVEQYMEYVRFMEKNTSGHTFDVMFFNKKILQEIFGNRISLFELGRTEITDFLTAIKEIHFIMQDVVSLEIMNLIKVETVEKEESAFDEYDKENGYEDKEENEENVWKIFGRVMERIIKIAIRILQESYGECLKENIMELLKYLKFELDTISENT